MHGLVHVLYDIVLFSALWWSIGKRYFACSRTLHGCCSRRTDRSASCTHCRVSSIYSKRWPMRKSVRSSRYFMRPPPQAQLRWRAGRRNWCCVHTSAAPQLQQLLDWIPHASPASLPPQLSSHPLVLIGTALTVAMHYCLNCAHVVSFMLLICRIWQLRIQKNLLHSNAQVSIWCNCWMLNLAKKFPIKSWSFLHWLR